MSPHDSKYGWCLKANLEVEVAVNFWNVIRRSINFSLVDIKYQYITHPLLSTRVHKN